MTRTQPKKIPFLHIILSLLLVAILGVILWLFFGKEAVSATPYEATNLAMGTYLQQTVYGKKGEEAAAAAAKAVSQLEGEISWRVEDSDVAKLNAAAGDTWEKINGDTFSLLQKALDVAQQSGGAYDPTILPLSSLWDFGGDNQRLPSQEELSEFLPYVGYENLRLSKEEQTASLKNRLNALDLGGAGKGAACDAAVNAYKDAGAAAAVVAAGGSIGLYGQKPGGGDWVIAIRDPKIKMEDESTGLGTLKLSSGFVSTTGVYEKYFEQDQRLYHHVLNPKTGYPAESSLLSVTVVCGDGALSDMLSTACFVLGLEESAPLLSHYGAEAVFVDKEDNVFVTGGLKDKLTLTAAGYTLKAWPAS